MHNLNLTSSTIKVFVLKSTPIVVQWASSNWSSVNRNIKLKIHKKKLHQPRNNYWWIIRSAFALQMSHRNCPHLDFPTLASPVMRSFKEAATLSFSIWITVHEALCSDLQICCAVSLFGDLEILSGLRDLIQNFSCKKKINSPSFTATCDAQNGS